MKKYLFLITLFFLSKSSYAYDIAVENDDGVTIYYSYTNNGTELEVTGVDTPYNGAVNIPETVTFMNRTRKVTAIGSYAFKECSRLTSVSIPNSVTSIGDYAFMYCRDLISVSIPSSVTYIGNGAFFDCLRLEFMDIPNNVTFIGESAFYDCRSLTSIVIPDKITTINRSTFLGCSGLLSVTIPNSVTSIGWQAFQSCTSLTIVKIPSSVTSIGIGAFYVCKGLTSLIIPNSVISIGESAFGECSSLTNVTIGNSVTSIGDYAFSRVDIPIVISFIENPFEINSDTFTQNTLKNATLYVPEGSIEKYKTTEGWKDFLFIESITELESRLFKLTYTIDGEEYKVCEVNYGADITPENAPDREGYTFSGWSEIPETMPPHDVTVMGSFAVNKYTLTYMVDGEVYKTSEVDYGTTITPEAAPTKMGYSFSGWDDVPFTMPAKDVTVTGTFTINKYMLIYKVDDEEYKSYYVEYNSAITAETGPTKEGYTFSGWSEIPETMPAHDVTVTGTFTINKYKLIYIVDGEEYKSIEVEYNSTITPEADPTKDGYNFSGWSDIPETMPAHDVTVTGSFERRYDVGNVTSLISFILRGNGGIDDLALYDMNGDGVLNIGDLILIVRKVLNSTKRSAITRADMNYLAPDLTQYSAAQFVLNVPENVREQDISLVEGIRQTHQMMCKQIEPGAYAVVVFSLTNSLFMPENGNIVEVNAGNANSDDLSIQDVMLAKPTGETELYGYMPVRTSISNVEIENDHRHVYNLKGQKQSRVNGMQKGVYIENGKKIVVR